MRLKARFEGIKTLKETLGEVDEASEKLLNEGLKLAVIAIHETAVKSMKQRSMGRTYKRGRKTHVASKPGSAPNVDTGILISGVRWEQDQANKIAAVGTDVQHGVYMEFGTSKVAPRPWLKPALRVHQAKLLKFFTGQGLKKFLKGK